MALSPLQAQITQLGEQMNRGFERLEQKISGFEDRVRAVEQREAGCQPLFASQIQEVQKKVNEHSARFQEVDRIITELRQANKILSWVGGLLASLVIVWFINQLLGLIK
jgi:predicted RNase H-like nuclease (RuvC/YqgF family)